ncbi:MAG: glycosyl hydrolase 2 galactose-binding domain-containing protein [Bacteroidota bacterium]
MFRNRILLFLLSLACYHASGSIITVSLDKNWEFRKVGDALFFPAVVPGSVHLDLLENKKIPDPFLSDNALSLGWIDTVSWEYRTFFVVNAAQLHSEQLQMEFEGLDTYAEVFLNGHEILSADNMFRDWKVDVKSFLKKGKNELRIVFSPVQSIAKQKQEQNGLSLPGGERVFARKAAFQWGWDFSPRILGCGIWKPVRLIMSSKTYMEDIRVRQLVLTDDSALVEVNTDVHSASGHEVSLRYVCDGSDVFKTTVLSSGLNRIRDTITIYHPKRWWVHTLGVPFLYSMEVSLSDGKQPVEIDSTRFGLRTIELIQENDSIGRSFYFRVNGIPVFMKGANVVPHDVFVSRSDTGWADRVMNDARSSHMNMLRIWGGGIYPSEYFYDACDRNGILVWQDFMAACSMLPGDSSFMKNLEQEAVEQVCRLRKHPSLAIWCGNNEADEGWHNWGWQKEFGYSEKDSAKVWQDYLNIFHKLLPQIVDRYDADRFYWPSSPSIGWGRKESLLSGDAHYWGVWWGMEPFSVYEKKVGRFMSEYGFQGLPGMATLREWCGTDRLDTTMPALKSHQQHPTGFQTITAYLKREYNHPVDFNSYVYLTQVQQADGIRMALEAHRRNRPRCMGTLFWQFNDCWPGISWSSIDYYGRWKALQYTVRSAFETLLISPVIDSNRKVDIYVVSDSLNDWLARMELQLIDMRGNLRWSEIVAADIKANTSSLVCTRDLSHIVRDADTSNLFLNVRLLVDERTVSECNRFFCSTRSLRLARPSFTVRSIASGNGKNAVVVRTSVFTKNVELSLDGSPSEFEENYFDMLPGRDYVVSVRKKDFVDSDMARLRYRSLYDTY